jgi:hypothetical protein
METGWRIVDQALHEGADFRHVGYQVVIVQDEHGLLLQAPCQRIEQRRQRLRADAPTRLLEERPHRFAPGRLLVPKGADQVRQEEERVAVGLGDGVPGQGGAGLGQRGQGGALTIAGAGQEQGQGQVESFCQARLQPRPPQDTFSPAGWDQLALDHPIFQRHSGPIIAHNRGAGKYRRGTSTALSATVCSIGSWTPAQVEVTTLLWHSSFPRKRESTARA